ncbi:aminoacyl-tRNA hydrolase [Patescibacteria group bacterium]
MRLIVGLGNPGEKYKKNRHNLGFILLDEISGLRWHQNNKLVGEVCTISKDPYNNVYVKPQTFMNKSGDCVSRALNYYKVNPQDLIVIHDDVDLGFGVVKRQFGSGSAGHKGVESIIDSIKTKDFWRVRVGIGRSQNPNVETDDWVLTNFSNEELEKIKSLLPIVTKHLSASTNPN